MPENFYPGRRLSFSGELCTVRYLGPVSGTTGEWVGVEWDDTSRGKHNGSYEGVKYFECQSQHPTAGSFIRLSRPHDRSLSFLEALRAKYDSFTKNDSFTLGDNNSTEIVISGKVVEEVGFDRIRTQQATLHALRIVLLDKRCVGGVVVFACPSWDIGAREMWLQERARIEAQRLSIVELDLSQNLIEEWTQVAGICGSLPSLLILNVSGNRFRDISLPAFILNEHQTPFSNVRELKLDTTLLSWDAIVSLTSFFPSLTILSATSNALTNLSNPLPNTSLQTLNLGSNLLSSLSDTSPLTSLPNLQTLSLRSNPLQTLTSPRFPTLSTLDVRETPLTDLKYLSPIPHTLPFLSSLLISKTPLAALPSASLLTIALLPSLTSLNFSPITPAERQNAELHYLARTTRLLESALKPAQEYKEDTVEEIAQRILADEYPRYVALCDKYGELTIAKRVSAAAAAAAAAKAEDLAGTLEARLVSFTFYMRSSDSDENSKCTRDPSHFSSPASDPQRSVSQPITQKVLEIPRSFNTYRVKGIVGREFGIRPMGCRLVWETGEWDPVGRDDEGEWSCGESSEEGEGEGGGQVIEGGKEDERERRRRKGRWVQREVELVDGMRAVGFWIEGKEARVRIERR